MSSEPRPAPSLTLRPLSRERRVALLDPHTVNQIAAGEVVERPASVVKELVENALDAGATRIQIRVVGAGRDLIEVSDDGCGMSPEDAQLALKRHATSKIRAVEDLHRTMTLGFRGEALPSMASVSRFRLATSAAGSRARTGQEGEALGTSGTRRASLSNEEAGGSASDAPRFVIEVEGGEMTDPFFEPGPVGTTISVADLFFNTPARLKFQKTPGHEMGLITEWVAKYAVAFPEVAFRLQHGNNLILETFGDGDLGSALAAVWGRETVRAMVGIDRVHEGVRVRGYVSPPHLTRPTRNQQWIFVNGRPIRNRQLYTAIDVAFRQLTPERRYPVAMLMLDIDPARVDMNVSPTKTEARFQQESQVFDAVRYAVKEALMASGMVPSAEALARVQEVMRGGYAGPDAKRSGLRSEDSGQGALTFEGPPRGRRFWRGDGGDGSVTSPSPAGPWNSGSSHIEPTGPVAMETQAVSQGFGTFAITGEPGARQDTGLVGPGPSASDSSTGVAPMSVTLTTGFPSGSGSPSTIPEAGSEGLPNEGAPLAGGTFARMLEGLKIHGQTQDFVFILAENRDGLMIIDQHVAHERILFEKLRETRGAAPLEVQPLLTPQALELDRRLLGVAMDHLEALGAAGFEIEPFGQTSLLVRGYPALIRRESPLAVLRDLIEDLAEGTQGSRLSPRENVWVMCSCKMAIKAGERLGMAEIEKLIWDLAQTENPYLCPHGRPITILMSRMDMLRKFKRA